MISEKIDNQTYFNNNQTVNWNNPPIVVAWEFSSAENLGALLRVCDNFGVKQVFFVGDEKDYKISKIRRNAITSFKKIIWEFVAKDTLWKIIPEETLKIAIDTTSESVALNQFDFNNLSSSYCLFFGNEKIGLDNEVVKQCDASVHIPMTGDSYSMNVVQSSAVILYEAVRQSVL